MIQDQADFYKEMTIKGVGPFCLGANVDLECIVFCDHEPGEPARQPTSLTDDGYAGHPSEVTVTGLEVERLTCYYDDKYVDIDADNIPSTVDDELINYFKENTDEILEKIE